MADWANAEVVHADIHSVFDVNQHLDLPLLEHIIFKYEIYYSYRTMEYKYMLKILMLIPGKFSTLIDTLASAS